MFAEERVRLRGGNVWFAAALLLSIPLPAYSHGAIVEAVPVAAIEVRARYDSGDVMGGAQISVFAPDDPASPWLRGTSDAEGLFRFFPDPSLPGLWAVQARQAGHGAITRFQIAPCPAATDPGTLPVVAVTTAPGGTTTPLQRLLMAAAIVWGFVGTALFFLRRPGG